jgi:hypothetical protein
MDSSPSDGEFTDLCLLGAAECVVRCRFGPLLRAKCADGACHIKEPPPVKRSFAAI